MANLRKRTSRRTSRPSFKVTVNETANAGTRPPRRPRRSSRARGLTGIEPGVGAYPARPYGGVSPNRWTARSARRAMCALSPLHMPLPRSIGPYTPIRVTRSITTTKKAMLLGPVMHLIGPQDFSAPGVWTTIVAISNRDDAGWTLPVNGDGPGGGNASSYALDVDPTLHGSMTPSAVTVQVICGDALQTVSGIVEISRLKFMPDLAATTDTWQDYTSASVALNPPRLCSAAKLAMRGVTCDLVPYNMNAMADFTRSDTAHNSAFVNLGTANLAFDGFAPLMVRNPGGVNLTYLVTVEYRTRFDPSNPACSSHTHHRAPPPGVWDNLIHGMSQEGHGIFDIVEAVAEAGEAVGGALVAHV